MYEFEDYRSFLKRTLLARSERNSALSISGLSRRLGIGRSFLSEVLSGRKNLSIERAVQVATRLGLSSEDTEYFSLLVQLGTHADAKVRERALGRLRELKPGSEVHDLSVDLFQTISEWYHLPLLELSLVGGAPLTAASAARALGISVLEAQTALERLLRLELLERVGGRFRKTSGYVLVESKIPHEAVTRYHQRMLEKATAAVSEQPSSERKSRTETFPLDPELLPEAEAILDRAAAELTRLCNRSKKPSRVYAATLHLFNLTPERKK